MAMKTGTAGARANGGLEALIVAFAPVDHRASRSESLLKTPVLLSTPGRRSLTICRGLAFASTLSWIERREGSSNRKSGWIPFSSSSDGR